MNKFPKIEEFVGRTIVDVQKITVDDEDSLYFTFDGGPIVKMFHSQDCCEEVWLESVSGDWDDLIDSPLLKAEKRTQDMPDAAEHGTWTFYTLATLKGYVDLTWRGESNGCYSEEVDLKVVEKVGE